VSLSTALPQGVPAHARFMCSKTAMLGSKIKETLGINTFVFTHMNSPFEMSILQVIFCMSYFVSYYIFDLFYEMDDHERIFR
jgi:hypothetical protein